MGGTFPRLYHTLFRFLNQPARRVSFGIETDLDTFEDTGLGSWSGATTTTPSSRSRSDDEANFFSLVMVGGWTLREGCGGGRGGFPLCWTWLPALSYTTSFSLALCFGLKGVNREMDRDIFLEFLRLEAAASTAGGCLVVLAGMSATAVAWR